MSGIMKHIIVVVNVIYYDSSIVSALTAGLVNFTLLLNVMITWYVKMLLLCIL